MMNKIIEMVAKSYADNPSACKGQYKLDFTDGSTAHIGQVNGVAQGAFAFYHPNGKQWVEGNLDKDSLLHGNYSEYYPSGNLKIQVISVHEANYSEFEQGLLYGNFSERSDIADSRPIILSEYEDNKLHGRVWISDKTGEQTQLILSFDNGKEIKSEARLFIDDTEVNADNRRDEIDAILSTKKIGCPQDVMAVFVEGELKISYTNDTDGDKPNDEMGM